MNARGWPTTRLREVLAEPIRNGYSPRESQAWTGMQMLGLGCLSVDGFAPLQLKNAPLGVSPQHKALLADGDLLVSRANTRQLVGLAGIYRDIGFPCLFPDLMMRVRLKEGYSASFLELVLRHHVVRRRIMSMAQGTSESMVKISGREFSMLEIPNIPLVEQMRILEVVKCVGEREQATEAAIDKLRTLRVGALMSVMPSLAAPEPAPGFVRSCLRDYVPTVEYGVSAALSREPVGTPVLRMNNLHDGRVVTDDLRYLPRLAPSSLLLRDGDVLFNRTNSIEHVGKSALWRGELSEATFASYLVRLVPDKQNLLPEYLVEWLQHPLIRQRIRAISTVAVQQVNVNPTRLRELEIDVPEDLDFQRKAVGVLSAFDDRIEAQREEQRKLAELKAGLVDDLLQGARRIG